MAATSLQPDSWRNTTPPPGRTLCDLRPTVTSTTSTSNISCSDITRRYDLGVPRYHNQTLNAQLKMSDVNTLLIEPLTKFVKDSAYLVKKCTKPDHKGISISIHSFTPCSTWTSRPHPSQSLTVSDLLLTNLQNLLRSQELLDSDF
jgi:hypothetical protein